MGGESSKKSILDTDDNGTARVIIDYDDGDRGAVAITEVRLLTSDFPITKVSSVLPTFITRSDRRSSAGERRSSNASTVTVDSSARSKPQTINIDQWKWEDEGTYNSRLKRTEHTAVRNGDVVIKVGDTVHLLHHNSREARCRGQKPPKLVRSLSDESITSVASEDYDRPYVARILAMWHRTKTGAMRVRCMWYYLAADLNCEHNLPRVLAKYALYTSRHEDDNSVETISGRCIIRQRSHFVADDTGRSPHDSHLMKARLKNADTCEPHNGVACYFIAGEYDALNHVIKEP